MEGAYKDVILFLATASVVAPLFRRAGLSPILGFLLAGVVLGPHGLGSLAGAAPWLSYLTVSQPAQFAELGEFGVVFLLFTVGLELSWERLRLMRRLVFGLGGAQLLASLAVVALAAGLMGAARPAALTIGAALALASTALVLPDLAEHKRLRTQAGRVSFAVLLFQDLAVAPILIALSLAGAGHAPARAGDLLLSLAPAVIGVAALIGGGRLVMRPMMRLVARSRSEELFLAACLLAIIGAGLLARLAGLSMAMGAFLAGLLLAETEFRRQAETLIEPLKGLLLGVFFVSVGVGLDVGRLIAHPLVLIGLTIGLVAAKAAIAFGLARAFGLATCVAAESALNLAGAGEFAFVVTAAGGGLGGGHMMETASLVAGLTMVASPLLTSLARRAGKALAKGEAPPSALPPPPTPPAALIVGYGRVGRLVGEMLTRHDIKWIAVERAARLVEDGRSAGAPVQFGDARRMDLLLHLGLDAARALIVTMDAPEATEEVTAAARGLRPDLVIVARARDSRHARRLYELGASDAVPEAIEASLQLSEAALVGLGVPMGPVIASIHDWRDAFRARLKLPLRRAGRPRSD